MVGEISTCCGYDADQTMATGCPCQWELIADKAVKAGYPHVDVLRVGDDYLVSRRSASRSVQVDGQADGIGAALTLVENELALEEERAS